ncbi:hypothetical protein NPIL_88501 [Nephila pilipes]|uniref:Uncharacterized protein n=1 Tax=Nephila pilipes TaxID=299642 RepID=A0A8X6UJV1_NEPPI|nr:hypothetical protein NPIL_88501 [Nephila pilipes]
MTSSFPIASISSVDKYGNFTSCVKIPPGIEAFYLRKCARFYNKRKNAIYAFAAELEHPVRKGNHLLISVVHSGEEICGGREVAALIRSLDQWVRRKVDRFCHTLTN